MIQPAKSNPQLLDEQIFSERLHPSDAVISRRRKVANPERRSMLFARHSGLNDRHINLTAGEG
jgi:hypothetical protein